jgi:hypothetical protein
MTEEERQAALETPQPTAEPIRHPCELLPPTERCDHGGHGGFMGHTCDQNADAIVRRWLGRLKAV